MFEDRTISVLTYNKETLLAEKMQTIINRGIANTRLRDFYDVYILGTTQRYDKKIFLKALEATAIHRGSREQMWEKYRKKFSYASEIQYADVMDVLIKMFQ